MMLCSTGWCLCFMHPGKLSYLNLLLNSAIEEEREQLLIHEDNRLSKSDCSSAADSGSAEFQAFLQSKLGDNHLTGTRARVRNSRAEFNVQKKRNLQ